MDVDISENHMVLLPLDTHLFLISFGERGLHEWNYCFTGFVLFPISFSYSSAVPTVPQN